MKKIGCFIKKVGCFVKKVIEFYVSIIKTLFPKTNYTTHFVPRTNYTEYLEISTTWLGQELKSEVFKLAHRKRRKEFLDDMLKQGYITKEKYKKCLPSEEMTAGDQ